MDELELMAAISQIARRRQASFLRGQGITLRQLELVRLARRRNRLLPSLAARELSCDRPTLTVIARNCVERGWLRRRPSGRDGRSKWLILTGTGEELIDRIDAAGEVAGDAAISGHPLDLLDEAERAKLRRLLERVLIRAKELRGDEE